MQQIVIVPVIISGISKYRYKYPGPMEKWERISKLFRHQLCAPGTIYSAFRFVITFLSSQQSPFYTAFILLLLLRGQKDTKDNYLHIQLLPVDQ
jgi:hypothetical protein